MTEELSDDLRDFVEHSIFGFRCPTADCEHVPQYFEERGVSLVSGDVTVICGCGYDYVLARIREPRNIPLSAFRRTGPHEFAVGRTPHYKVQSSIRSLLGE